MTLECPYCEKDFQVDFDESKDYSDSNYTITCPFCEEVIELNPADLKN